jgi:hypothetical protein
MLRKTMAPNANGYLINTWIKFAKTAVLHVNLYDVKLEQMVIWYALHATNQRWYYWIKYTQFLREEKETVFRRTYTRTINVRAHTTRSFIRKLYRVAQILLDTVFCATLYNTYSRRGVKLTTLSIAMHNNAWTSTSTPPHAFKALCSVKHWTKDRVILTIWTKIGQGVPRLSLRRTQTTKWLHTFEPEDEHRSRCPNVVLWGQWTTDKVQQSTNDECDVPSRKAFTSQLYHNWRNISTIYIYL